MEDQGVVGEGEPDDEVGRVGVVGTDAPATLWGMSHDCLREEERGRSIPGLDGRRLRSDGTMVRAIGSFAARSWEILRRRPVEAESPKSPPVGSGI
jgi:hypothetical protein